MAVRSVQFVNAQSVLAAYESREVPDFTIWHDKQYLFKYDGGDLSAGAAYLADLLDKLGQSAAIYTLKVYEEGHERINDKTAHDGSFNFRFLDAPVYNTPGHGSMNGAGKLQAEIEALKEKISDLEHEGGEGERNDNGVMGAIGQVLEHPAIMPLIPLIMEKIVAALTAKPAPGAAPGQPQLHQHQYQPGQVGQLNRVSGIDTAGKKKIDQALVVLDKHVDDLPELITKLAWLAENKNMQFKMAVGMLQNIK